MSGLIVGLVLRQPITKEFNTEAKFIATVYADHAWEDGTHAYPAVDTVAGMIGLHPRTVQRYLRLLESLGMLILDGKGPRGTNKYKFPLETKADGSIRLALEWGGAVPPWQPDGGDTESGDTESGGTGVTQTNNPSLDLVVNDADVAKIAKVYEHEIGALTPLIADAIRDACKTYPPDWIPEAITIAVQNNARRWNYVEAILKNCKTAGKRPSLNRLENTHGATTRTGNKSGTKSAGHTKANPAKPVYSDADRRAAERVKAKQQTPVS